MTKMQNWAGLVCICVWAKIVPNVQAQNYVCTDEHATIEPALLKAVTLKSKTYIRHCKRHSKGCEQFIHKLVQHIVHSSEQYSVDPWLIAAVAFHETGLNPWAMGKAGERGVMQLHPKGPAARKVRFVKSKIARARCKKQPDACQQDVVYAGVRWLAKQIKRCGSLKKGLGAYNTGRCGGNPKYANRVIWTRKRLMKSVQEVPTMAYHASAQ